MNLGEVQIFLEQGTPSPQGCSVYFVVGDADELYAFHRANGVEIVEPPGDRAYGFRDYTVRDLHGYRLTFGHHLLNTGDRRSRSSAWTSPCAWRSGWPRCCTTSPSTSG